MDVIVPFVATPNGQSSVFVRIVGDASHASPGDPITGVINTDIDSISYISEQTAVVVETTIGTIAADNTFYAVDSMREVDATNLPGVYRFDLQARVNNPSLTNSIVRANKCTVVIVVDSSLNALIDPINFTIDYGVTASDAVYIKRNGGQNDDPQSMGGALRPVDNMQDAFDISTYNNKRHIIISDPTSTVFMPTQDVDGYLIESTDPGVHLNLNSNSPSGSIFKNMIIVGTLAANANKNEFHNCVIDTTTAFEITKFKECMLNTLKLDGFNVECIDCYTQPACIGALAVTIDLTASDGPSAVFTNFSGSVNVVGMTGEFDALDFIGGGGEVFTIDNSCTNGFILLNGQWDRVEDNSGGLVTVIYAQALTSIRDQGVYRAQGANSVPAFTWPFAMYDSTTGELAAGLTVTGTVVIDGAAPVAITGTIAEAGGGYYEYTSSVADIGGGDLFAHKVGFTFSATGAKDASLALPVMR